MVRQTEEVHQQIDALLEQLRKGSGKRKTVTVDARWLLLNSDDLEKLLGGKDSDTTEIDPQVLAEYTRRASSIRGLTNCFSGQLVYLVSGTRKSVVTSVIPVVGSVGRPQDFGAQFASRRSKSASGSPPYVVAGPNPAVSLSETVLTPVQMKGEAQGSVGYQPVVEKPNFGALLEIRPTLIPDANQAIVDLRSTITVPGEVANAPAPRSSGYGSMGGGFEGYQGAPGAGPGGYPGGYPGAVERRGMGGAGSPQVDRVAIETQELATTMSLPLGQPVLVGGLTYVTPTSLAKSAPPATQNEPQETPQLYLILQISAATEK